METLDQALGVDRGVQGERVAGGVGGDVEQFKFVVINGKPCALELPTHEPRELGEREVNGDDVIVGRPAHRAAPARRDRSSGTVRGRSVGDQQRVDNGYPSGARLNDYRVQVPGGQHVTEIDSKPGNAAQEILKLARRSLGDEVAVPGKPAPDPR